MQFQAKEKLWILASGSLDGYPRKGCDCILCRLARKGGKDRRLNASSVLYKKILFDVGPGVWDRVSGQRERPRAIVLSHTHYDHIADLIYFPKLSRRIPVYTSSLHKDLFEHLDIKARYFEPNATFRVPGLKIETRLVVHTFTRPCSLLKFDNIIYAPDLGSIHPSDLKWAEGTKLWLGDGFNFEEDFTFQGQKLHMSMKKLIRALKKLKSLKTLIFIGLGHHQSAPHEDLELYVRKYMFQQNTQFAVEISFDNQIISV